MKDVKKKKKSSKKVLQYKILSFLLIIVSVILMSIIIYNEVFSLSILIPIIIVTLLVVLLLTKILNSHLKRWIKNIFAFITFNLIVVLSILSIFGTKTLKFISNLTDTGYRVETYGVYVLNDSNYKSIHDLDGKDIGVLDEEDEYTKKAINILDNKIENTIVEKHNLEDLLTSIINKKIDAIMIEESYESTIKDEFENVLDRLNKIDTFDVVHIVETIKSTKNITKDTFMIYLSGIDTTVKNVSKARSDVNILVGINPKTNKILMINTPRDYYITLHTKQKQDKLTHAGLYGIEESVKVLEDLYGIKVDYYARFNFSSFIDVINALDGIKVNVKYNICEQDSKRNKSNKICVYKGLRTLNGEQALAYARHRKTIGDRQRGKNQMDVVEGIINKALSPSIITNYLSILDALEGKVITNVEYDDIKKFVNMQIKKDPSWSFETISADGTNASAVAYSTGNYKVSVIKPDINTINDIKTSIDNLYNNKKEIVITTTSTKKTL